MALRATGFSAKLVKISMNTQEIALYLSSFRAFSVQVLTKLWAPPLNRFLIQGWEATKIRLNRKQ
jgi:hypothetical protein